VEILKRLFTFFALVSLFIVGACAGAGSDDINIKELVHAYSIGDHADGVSASITSHELVVSQDGKETTYDLPEDKFFVSIAPYESQTHD